MAHGQNMIAEPREQGYSSRLSGALLVGGGTSPSPAGWPAPTARDNELGLPLKID